MEKLKCPHCRSININIDVCNGTYRENDKVIKEYSGCCMDCRTWLTWEENFQFEGYSNIKIDN